VVSGRKSRYQPDKSYAPTVEVRVALARSLRLDIWIWIVSRQGPRTGASHRRGDDYGVAWLDSRLLNSAKEPADTTDWGKVFQSFTVLIL